MNTSISRFILVIFAEITIIVLSAESQVTEQWVKRYNGPGNARDGAFSIALDISGNIYVTGYSTGSGTYEDYCTIKYNSSGVQQWAQRYDGPRDSTDEAYSIAVDSAGNVYVTGWSKGTGSNFDYCTIKYNPSGLVSYIQRYNGPGNSTDKAYSIAVDNSGNVYVTGGSTGIGTGVDFRTIKYNSSGVQQWVSTYNGPGNGSDEGYSIAIDNSGNVYVTGTSMGGSLDYDFCTIKYNSSGVQQWVRRYDVSDHDGGYKIAVDNSGNVHVTGEANGLCTIKYNSLGVQQWINIPPSTIMGASIVLDKAGNIYVTGSSLGIEPYDYCTIKYNSSGVQQWIKDYNGTGNSDDYAFSVAVDNSGNVYVTGSSKGIGTDYDYSTVKYNSSGVQQWEQRYNGPGNRGDNAYSITVDNTGNIYVTGRSEGITSDFDYCTIKYHDPIGIKKISSEVPSAFSLYQNYPNPFNPSTKIKFALPCNSFVRLSIYDLMGREIEELIKEQLSAGNYEAEWNSANLASGVYFYKMTSGDFAGVKKMVIVK